MNLASPQLRQRLNLMRCKLAILLNTPDRLRRRRAVARFKEPSTFADLWSELQGVLDEAGFANWNVDPRSFRSLAESWRSVQLERAADKQAAVERSTGKAFFVESLSLKDLQSYPAFASIALDESLLFAVMRTLGVMPHLESVEIVVSTPTDANLSASQLWHRDVNDRRIVKLFVYLEPVHADEGPFTYLPADASRAVPPGLSHYLRDEEIARFAAMKSLKSVTGPAGTAFLIDTSRCFHYGSRCTKPRVVYIATYSCGIKYMKYAARWADVFGERSRLLSPLQRAVCGLAG